MAAAIGSVQATPAYRLADSCSRQALQQLGHNPLERLQGAFDRLDHALAESEARIVWRVG